MHLFSFNRPFTSIAARAAAIAIALSAATSLVHAQIYTELGDAGSTQAGAQNTGFVQTLNGGDFTILGTFLSPTDADVYRLTINSPTTFSASTVNTLTASNGGAGGLDTQLFLFDSAGHAIVM